VTELPFTAVPSSAVPSSAVSSTGQRRWLAGGSIVCVLLLALAVSNAVDLIAHDEEVLLYEVTAGGVDAIEVSTENGDVIVVGADVKTITVRAEVSHGLRPTRTTQELDGGRLMLRGSCPLVPNVWCRADYRIEVPREVAVESRSRYGEIEVAGVDGAVLAVTGQGAMELRDVGGPLKLETGHGDLDATDLRSPTVEVTTGHGRVLLAFQEPPNMVEAYSSDGRIDIEVPDEPVTYAVDAGTRSGKTTSAVRTDPASTRAISARTDHGEVTIRYRAS
jgi:hypothetical protein